MNKEVFFEPFDVSKPVQDIWLRGSVIRYWILGILGETVCYLGMPSQPDGEYWQDWRLHIVSSGLIPADASFLGFYKEKAVFIEWLSPGKITWFDSNPNNK